MKFTVFTVLLSISTTWAIKAKIEEPKDKREASGTYLPPSSHNYQSPSSLGQDDASSISIGAGYSVGGAKPTYSFAGQGAGVGASYQLQSPQEGGHGNIQLAPITLQPSHGGLVSNDLSQLMSQLSHGLNTGAITIPSSGSQGGLYQFAGQGGHGGQEVALPQFTYASPQLQQYSLGESQGAVPAYAVGTKGLGTYGATGPVLFSPESSTNQAAQSYVAPGYGQSYEAAALPLGDSGHSFPGFSFGGQSSGGSLKAIGGSYPSSGKASFKPSAFLGATVQNDAGSGLASLSGSYAAAPSFAAYQPSSGGHGLSSLSSGGHGASFGSFPGFSGGPSKFVAASYLPSKPESFGSVESIASAFSASGQLGSSPPGTTYGTPSGAYSGSNTHAASAPAPTYYLSPGKHSSPSFGLGSSSYRSPVTGHSSLNSFSSGPKYSFGGHGGSRYAPSKDAQGSYSESNYNTIKYSEELKPHYN